MIDLDALVAEYVRRRREEGWDIDQDGIEYHLTRFTTLLMNEMSRNEIIFYQP